MLRRVSINGYKSLHNVEVFFNESPLTVIMGPNAAGKSNLFDALALLSRMATSETLQKAFEAHRGTPLEAFSYGSGGLKELLEHPTAEFTVEVDFDLSSDVVTTVRQQIVRMREGIGREANPLETATQGRNANASAPSETLQKNTVAETRLRYSLTVQILTDQGYLRVLDEQLTPLRPQVRTGVMQEAARNRNPFVEKVQNARGEPKLSLRLEGQAHPTYYDVGLDHTLLSTPLYPPHYPHLVAAREELSRWRFYYLEPRAMREPSPLKTVTTLSPTGADLAAFYNTLKVERPRQFESVRRSLKVLIPSIETFDVERTPDGFVQIVVQESGIQFSSRVISEGTLRVLGLLAITNPPSTATLIGFEEPENGVHPHRLRQIAEVLRSASERDSQETQIIVNTHSPILPQYFVGDRLLICRRGPEGTLLQPMLEGLWLQQGIEGALEESAANPDVGYLPFVEAVTRGDFGG